MQCEQSASAASVNVVTPFLAAMSWLILLLRLLAMIGKFHGSRSSAKGQL